MCKQPTFTLLQGSLRDENGDQWRKFKPVGRKKGRGGLVSGSPRPRLSGPFPTAGRPLLNYFEARKQYSSGVVEGLNSKVKLTLKRAYGFRTADAREVALFHALGKLPEPQFTHSFF